MDYNFDNERPIYIQLKEKIKMQIVSGYYNLNSKLPSVRELALTAKANPNTVQKSLQELENEGLIYTERTNGKYVTKDKKLIEKIKMELAKEIIDNYFVKMNNIGINKKDACEFIKKIGDKK